MKKIIIIILCAVLIGETIVFADKISDFLTDKFITNEYVYVPESNSYAKNDSFMFVSKTEDFVPYSYQDLLNILYSAIDNGWETFTFYCPNEYEACIDDISKISDDDLTLTHINNYVHPYNTFTKLATDIYKSGEITIHIEHVYSDEQIEQIDNKIDEIIKNVTSDDKSAYDNLKALHDYIINNTKYDQTVTKDGESKYKSNIAWGLLFEGYATCNGYTDTMAIILTKLGYKNYKIATTPEQINYEYTGHVWNAVLFDKDGTGPKWLHIDLTWDDPVAKSGKDYLYDKYFLVDNEGIKKVDSEGETKIEEHNFDPKIYLEFNDSIKEIIPDKATA